jgi:hypothetical protein
VWLDSKLVQFWFQNKRGVNGVCIAIAGYLREMYTLLRNHFPAIFFYFSYISVNFLQSRREVGGVCLQGRQWKQSGSVFFRNVSQKPLSF